jgi:hypothetical protein
MRLEDEEIVDFLQNDDESAPLYAGEVLNDVTQQMNRTQQMTINTELIILIDTENYNDTDEDNDPDIRLENDEYESENNKNESKGQFTNFKSLYLRFLKFTEQVELKNFIEIGAKNQFDDVECNLENLEMVLRRLSLKERKKPANPAATNCQLTINDFFAERK